MGFPRQEYWSGLPFPTPGDLPDVGIDPLSPALGDRFFIAEPPGKPHTETLKTMSFNGLQGSALSVGLATPQPYLLLSFLWFTLLQSLGLPSCSSNRTQIFAKSCCLCLEESKYP